MNIKKTKQARRRRRRTENSVVNVLVKKKEERIKYIRIEDEVQKIMIAAFAKKRRMNSEG